VVISQRFRHEVIFYIPENLNTPFFLCHNKCECARANAVPFAQPRILYGRVVMVLRRGPARTPRAIHPLVHTCWSSLHVHRRRNKEHSRACAKGAPYYSPIVSPPPRHHNTTTRNRNDLPLLLHSWNKPNTDGERRHSGNNSSSNGNIPAHQTANEKGDRATTMSVGHVRENCIARNFARMTRATDAARVAHFIALFDAKAILSSFVIARRDRFSDIIVVVAVVLYP